jgi:hypothetical protein
MLTHKVRTTGFAMSSNSLFEIKILHLY